MSRLIELFLIGLCVAFILISGFFYFNEVQNKDKYDQIHFKSFLNSISILSTSYYRLEIVKLVDQLQWIVDDTMRSNGATQGNGKKLFKSDLKFLDFFFFKSGFFTKNSLNFLGQPLDTSEIVSGFNSNNTALMNVFIQDLFHDFELKLIKSAMSGASHIVLVQLPAQSERVALLIVPKMSSDKVVGVIAAHVDLSFFKESLNFYMDINLFSSINVVDSYGNYLFKKNNLHHDESLISIRRSVGFCGLSLLMKYANNVEYYSVNDLFVENKSLLIMGLMVTFLSLIYFLFKKKLFKLFHSYSVKQGPVMGTFVSMVFVEPEKFLKSIVSEEEIQDESEVLNQLYELIKKIIEKYNGLVLSADHGNWVIGWYDLDCSKPALNDSYKAIQCVLELRSLLLAWNESRKNYNLKVLLYGLGVSSGESFLLKKGEGSDLLSESIYSAQCLAGLAIELETDCLVVQELWNGVQPKFINHEVSELPFVASVKLVKLSGLKNEDFEGFLEKNPNFSKIRLLNLPQEQREPSHEVVSRWLINNGTQIVGPWTAQEIAKGLFAQELDFDSLCWTEYSGESAMIKNANIFKGSGDGALDLWIFDEQIVHGPFGIEFLKTAIQLGAISTTVWVCEGSTVQGWIPLSVFLNRQKESSSV